jgi:ubiquinone/menaquinone biosynthesis C-methylase UbiE
MGDLGRALAHYRGLAPHYDRSTRRINAIRLKAIEALGLRPGQTVLDAGCGTGWCIPHLAARVGPGGHVVAFDPSPDMLVQAHARPAPADVAVALLQASAEAVVLPAKVDAILFSYTHDLIRSRAALENLLRQARPRARVASTSTKLYAPWLFPANWYLRATHRAYITDFEGFEAPWSLLATHLDDFRVDTAPWTQHYVATGAVRAAQLA